MRVIRWKNAVTGVESLNITATGIYFPVGKTDSSFIARYSMASAGQTASVERVSSPNGSRVGSPAINVSGTTEVVVNERRGLSTGIIVTAISGTLISVLDDKTPITNFPDAGLGRFPAKEDADAYVYGAIVPQGIPAIINGVPYSWSGTAWDAVGGGGGLPVFANYAALPAPTLGLIAQIPRLCGNGYFALRANGTRWEVYPGESIIRDAGPASAGYDLTATGTAYVALASYTIPAGLIGDGEEWEGDQIARNNGILTAGNDAPTIRIAGSGFMTNSSITGTNRVCRNRNAFVRLGEIISFRVGVTDLYTNQTSNDADIDLSLPQTIDAGFAPGAVGNTMRLRYWAFRRIA